MKKLLRYIGIGGALLAGATVIPLVPENMTLAYSYDYPVGQYQAVLTPASATSSAVMNPAPNFKDIDGDGFISVSVFTDNLGNTVYVQIPHTQYKTMGKVGGYASNPTHTQLITALDALASPTPASAAIARDTSAVAVSSASGTSVTLSYTNNGTELTAFVYEEASDALTSVTYNGAGLTEVGKYHMCYSAGSNDHTMSGWYIMNPSTGSAQNLVATRTTSTSQINLVAMSYTGAGIPNASTFAGNGTPGSCTGFGTSFSVNVTTVTDNSWIVGAVRGDAGGTQVGTGSWTKLQQGASGEPSIHVSFDSNGAITPLGLKTVGDSGFSGNANFAFAVLVLPPAAAAAPDQDDNQWFLLFP